MVQRWLYNKTHMRQTIVTLCILSCITTFAQNSRIVCDDTTCKTAFIGGKTGGDGYSVVSPVGTGTVEHIRMAPGLETLAGKIQLVCAGTNLKEAYLAEILRKLRIQTREVP